MGRREAQKRMGEMQESFRASVREGRLSSRQMLPSVRELAEQFGLSHMAVARSLQGLVEEGVLHSVPRVGFFVGAPVNRDAGTYLLVFSTRDDLSSARNIQTQAGFENQISKLGGSSVVMSVDMARSYQERGEMPQLAGVFNMATLDLADELDGERTPRVRFGVEKPDRGTHDAVSFNDFTGGGQATRHLLGLSHRQIAFLGLHTREDARLHLRALEDDGLMWSVKRHDGWKEALGEARISSENLYFHPSRTPSAHDHEQQTQAGYEAALVLSEQLDRQKITAVVAVNGAACQGLLQAFQTLQMSRSAYPALVAFDDETSTRGQVVSSLRLPWHELGRTAADLLWERHQGLLLGPPIHRSVPMRLIPRLSCRADWNMLALAS